MKKSTRRTEIVTKIVIGTDAVIKIITKITAIKERPVLSNVSSMKTTYCSKLRYSIA